MGELLLLAVLVLAVRHLLRLGRPSKKMALARKRRAERASARPNKTPTLDSWRCFWTWPFGHLPGPEIGCSFDHPCLACGRLLHRWPGI